jgi:hypothetical protein
MASNNIGSILLSSNSAASVVLSSLHPTLRHRRHTKPTAIHLDISDR